MKNVSDQLRSQNSVESIEDYFEKPVETPKKRKSFAGEEGPKLVPIQKVTETKIKKEKEERYNLSADPLMADARNSLNYYLKRIPSFNSMEAQKVIITKEMNIYKKTGDEIKFQQCVEILKSLNEKTSGLKELFVPVEGVKLREKIKSTNEKIKSSPKLKELRDKEKEIKNNIEKSSASKYFTRLTNLRKLMKIDENKSIDIENYFDDKENLLHQNYNELLTEISEITGLSVEELYEMPLSNIRDYLKDNLESVFEDNNEDLKLIRAEMQAEKDALSGAISMTSILDSVYDITKEKDVEATKNILASTHIGMVKSIAYTACNNAGLKGFEFYDDTIGAGLLALTVAINGFLKLRQENPGSSLSFKGWARVNITNAIKRELWTMQSGGRVSGSRIADMITREKRKIDAFLENYPVYKDFDTEIVKEMVLASESEANEKKYANTNDISLIVTESEIKAGGEGSDDGADIWANAGADHSFDMIEAKSEYGELVKNIAILLEDMDKYEKKLFMLYFGFEKKIEKTDNTGKKVTNNYNQEEIGRELFMYYKSQGATPAKVTGDSFSQPAIVYKITKLREKLVEKINKSPELKKGLEFLTTYWMQNSDALSVLSNDREEFGMKFDRDKLRDNFIDNEDVLNIQLSDGKKLRDEFNLSDSNMMNNQLYDTFIVKNNDFGKKVK